MSPEQLPLTPKQLARISVSGDGCWNWATTYPKTGYGALMISRRNYLMHRWSYEQLVGPIPDGLQLDHLCRNRACCNPAHLEPVTCRENVLRSSNQAAENAVKTHCKRGHPLSGPNLYLIPKSGRRNCRTCRAYADQKRSAA